jgi:hypothetical protein
MKPSDEGSRQDPKPGMEKRALTDPIDFITSMKIMPGRSIFAFAKRPAQK